EKGSDVGGGSNSARREKLSRFTDSCIDAGYWPAVRHIVTIPYLHVIYFQGEGASPEKRTRVKFVWGVWRGSCFSCGASRGCVQRLRTGVFVFRTLRELEFTRAERLV